MNLVGPPKVKGPCPFLFVRRSDCGLVCVFVETNSGQAGMSYLRESGGAWSCLAGSRARVVAKGGERRSGAGGGAGYLSPRQRVFNVRRARRGQGKLGGLAGFLKLRLPEWRQRPGGLSEVGNQAGFAPQKAANVGGRGWLSGLGQGLAFKPPAFQKPVWSRHAREGGGRRAWKVSSFFFLFLLPRAFSCWARGPA